MELNKWERIQLVKQLGLNTENSILICGAITKLQQQFMEKYGYYSIRTFTLNENCFHPHLPVVSRENLEFELEKLLSANFSCIVAEGIDPQFCELAGCGYKKGRSVTLEIAFGAGTVRRVTHSHEINLTVQTGVFDALPGDYRLVQAIQKMRAAKIDNCIFEFSYYGIPAGHKHENLIFWEITGADSKGSIEL